MSLPRYIYREASMRILISLNNCLQDVLGLTPIIDLITFFFYSTYFFLFELSSFPLKTVFQTVNVTGTFKNQYCVS